MNILCYLIPERIVSLLMYPLLHIGHFQKQHCFLQVSSCCVNMLGKPINWTLLREHFTRGGILEKEDCITIVKMAMEILKKEPNVLALNDPVTVIGDIHGQFYDLLKILEIGGDLATTK
jgi:hypothetical protein